MAPPRIIDTVAKSNSIASWGERVWRWAGLVGIPTWLKLTVGPAVITVWVYASHLLGPWLWLVGIPLGLWTLTQFIKVYSAFKIAKSVQGVKRIDVNQIGKICVDFGKDLQEFLTARDSSKPDFIRKPANEMGMPSHPDIVMSWEETYRYSSQTDAKARERFGSRAVVVTHLVQTLGITPPLIRFFGNDIARMAIYIGAIGELLEMGLLTEAREFKPDPFLRVHLR